MAEEGMIIRFYGSWEKFIASGFYRNWDDTYVVDWPYVFSRDLMRVSFPSKRTKKAKRVLDWVEVRVADRDAVKEHLHKEHGVA